MTRYLVIAAAALLVTFAFPTLRDTVQAAIQAQKGFDPCTDPDARFLAGAINAKVFNYDVECK